MYTTKNSKTSCNILASNFLRKRELKSMGHLQSAKFVASANSEQVLYIGLLFLLLGLGIILMAG